jgi:seryl-tRNA synthetase
LLDIRMIRDQWERLQRTADRKGIAVSIRELLQSDEERRRLVVEIERLRHARNRLSEQIGEQMRSGEMQAVERLKQQVRQSNEALAAYEAELEKVEREYGRMMLLVPNVVSPDTPDGASDADNVEVKRFGEPPIFGFEPRDHVTLGEMLDILDLPRGVKMAGTRNYVLKGAGFHLHRAVQQLALDVLERRGFTPMDVPMMVRSESLLNTGFFPLGRDQTFALADEDKYLIGTSEVSLVSYYSNEVIDVSQQPIRLAGASSCFRSEIGSAGGMCEVSIAYISLLRWSRLCSARMTPSNLKRCCRRLREMPRKYCSCWSCLTASYRCAQEICRRRRINNTTSRPGCRAGRRMARRIPPRICSTSRHVARISGIGRRTAACSTAIR